MVFQRFTYKGIANENIVKDEYHEDAGLLMVAISKGVTYMTHCAH